VIVRGTHGMFGDTFSTVYYKDPFRVGEERVVADLTARVLEIDEAGLPMAVRFEFDAPLEDKTFVVYEGRGFHEVALPAPGARFELPATPFLEALSP
jgi:hypothetical protein